MRLVLLLVLVSGCVTTHPAPLDTPAGRDALNARTSGRVATLYAGGERHAAREVHVGPDETTWVDRLTGAPRSAPTQDVRAVSLRQRFAWQPLLIGAGIGAATGALASVMDSGGCGGFFCFTPTPLEYIATFGLGGAAIGGVVGTSQTERFVPPRRAGVRLDTLR